MVISQQIYVQIDHICAVFSLKQWTEIKCYYAETELQMRWNGRKRDARKWDAKVTHYEHFEEDNDVKTPSLNNVK